MKCKLPFPGAVLIALPFLFATCSQSGRAEGALDAVYARDVAKAAAALTQNPGVVNAHSREQSDGQTLLHIAVLNTDIPMMNLLLDRGANTEIVDNDGVTPLQMAAEYDRKESANLLLARGAKADLNSAVMLDRLDLARRALAADPQAINARSHYNRTPLHWAARANYQEMVAWLLARGAEPNLKLISGYTPLQETLSFSYIEVARMLLEHKADPNIPDDQGQTPLHRVVYGLDPRRNLDMAALLLAHGANLEARDPNGRTPLFDGLRTPRMAALMLAYGADVNAHANYGMTPLGAAPSTEALQMLLDRGANMRFVDAKGWTPLHFLASSGDPALLRLALAHGANPRARTLTGRTPLHVAARQGVLDVVDLLVRKGAAINATERLATQKQPNAPRVRATPAQKPARSEKPVRHVDTLTPLREAALGKRLEVVKYLLAHGAHADIFAATLLGDSETLARLLQKDPKSANLLAPNGTTPLLMAVEAGNEAVVRQLLVAGAAPRVRAPQLYGGGAAELAHYAHHETIATLIREWSAQSAAPPSHP